MLHHLWIQNFALIEKATIDFDEGFSVITGETGSGKSILLNAINLLLGERADFKIIGKHNDKAVVEGAFAIETSQYATFFTENELDTSSPVLIRREISTQGRSRAFINDTPVQLSVLKQLTQHLLTIHSQYNTLDLKNKEFQLKTLDVLIGAEENREEYTKDFVEFKQLKSKLEHLQEQFSTNLQEKDFKAFQLQELEKLELDTVNYTALEEEFNRMENVDEIKGAIEAILNKLDDEVGAVGQLNELKAMLLKTVEKDTLFTRYLERIDSTIIELRDVQESATMELENVTFNPQKMAELQTKLDAYNSTLLKFKVNNSSELEAVHAQLSEEIGSSEELEKEIQATEHQLEEMEVRLQEQANQLHQKRVEGKEAVEKQMELLLQELKLPNTKLIFEIEKVAEYNQHGADKVSMLFSANKGIAPVSIENAASGGELSRVMLALQQLISDKKSMPTIFFDEIDTGVSGDVAEKIGNLLRKMSKNVQLLTISHLPQVAARAGQHFRVVKHSEKETTITSIHRLSENERIEEIARLMSGEIINDAALENAKALMG